MTELLVGTKKGLFVLDGDAGTGVRGDSAGVSRAVGRVRDARSSLGSLPGLGHLAGSTAAEIWIDGRPRQANGRKRKATTLPEDGDASLARIWVIAAGRGGRRALRRRRPGRACSRATTVGCTWALNRGLWDHPTRPDWTPGGGGLCLHTIVPWPGDPDRLMVAISAVGVWLSDDGGATWRHSNSGIVPEYLPEEARDDPAQHCVHNVRRSARRPERLFMQFHGGVYRSDDAGATWIDVGDGTDLPSDFGFPIVVDPGRPRQRLRDPADRRRGQDDAGRRGPGLGDTRRRRHLDPARRWASAAATPT